MCRRYIAQTLAHPSLPPDTRYLSMNRIFSAGLVCPLTTSRECACVVRLYT
jgi:hypothetical protein